MASRWKHDRPLSRAQFEARFPDDAACAAYLSARRWPEGFVCPGCGGAKGWALKTKAHTWECASCRRQPPSGPHLTRKAPQEPFVG